MCSRIILNTFINMDIYANIHTQNAMWRTTNESMTWSFVISSEGKTELHEGKLSISGN